MSHLALHFQFISNVSTVLTLKGACAGTAADRRIRLARSGRVDYSRAPVVRAGTLRWKGGDPMRSVTGMGLGLSGVLLLGLAARSAGAEKGARAEPVLEIMSLDP